MYERRENMRYRDREWQQRKRFPDGNNGMRRSGSFHRLDVRNSIQKDPLNTNPFFFTNFPDIFGNELMWKVFNLYGKVTDVYIPPKRNKDGDNFGFVRFANLQDSRAMEAQLDSILIGNQKPSVNIPRYERGFQKQRMPINNQPNRVIIDLRLRSGVSYVDAVNGDARNEKKKVVRRYSRNKKNKFLSPSK